MDTLNLQAIYAKLLEGKKITLRFLDNEDAENFRTRMSRHKKIQEEVFAVVDMKAGTENKICSFKKNIGSPPNWTVYFSERPPEIQYTILAIE